MKYYQYKNMYRTLILFNVAAANDDGGDDDEEKFHSMTKVYFELLLKVSSHLLRLKEIEIGTTLCN